METENRIYEDFVDRYSLVIMAGPCAIETQEYLDIVAAEMVKLSIKYNFKYVFKSSFDKANRSSINSMRGPGIDKGLQMLARVKSRFNVPVMTDIHEAWQSNIVKEVVDIIQIPAYLCRQTDLLVAAGYTGKIINIKKAQFLAPWDMKNVVEKIRSTGNNKIVLCERGSCFGYNRLVVDFTGMLEMNKIGVPIVFDATHSVQLPGGLGTKTGGNREYVSYLAKAAAAIGINNFFFETHPEPDIAISDGPNMLALKNMELLIQQLIEIKNLVNTYE